MASSSASSSAFLSSSSQISFSKYVTRKKRTDKYRSLYMYTDDFLNQFEIITAQFLPWRWSRCTWEWVTVVWTSVIMEPIFEFVIQVMVVVPALNHVRNVSIVFTSIEPGLTTLEDVVAITASSRIFHCQSFLVMECNVYTIYITVSSYGSMSNFNLTSQRGSCHKHSGS